VYFKTFGEYTEVGVEFIDINGNKQKQVLEKQEDNIYIVAFSQIICE
jgi:hypothetical protein